MIKTFDFITYRDTTFYGFLFKKPRKQYLNFKL